MLVNARHVKNVPGCKTDVSDAQWLCQLMEAGLLRSSFVPPSALLDRPGTLAHGGGPGRGGRARMWLYRAHPGNPRTCAGADHSQQQTGRHRTRSILSSRSLRPSQLTRSEREVLAGSPVVGSVFPRRAGTPSRSVRGRVCRGSSRHRTGSARRRTRPRGRCAGRSPGRQWSGHTWVTDPGDAVQRVRGRNAHRRAATSTPPSRSGRCSTPPAAWTSTPSRATGTSSGGR